MRKEFLKAESQIALLERRGMSCDEASPSILMREGYYAVINGYAKPFIDPLATHGAGDDRYLTDADAQAYTQELAALRERYAGISTVTDRVIEATLRT